MGLRAAVCTVLILFGSILFGVKAHSETAHSEADHNEAILTQKAHHSTALDRYVEEGLRNNLALRQKYFNLEESMEALKEARRMFFPSLFINARYTWASGGREMTLPVGDMLNDIYEALNEVTAGHPYPTDFEDESLPIMPEREQETKMTFVQPLVMPKTIMNLKIQSRLRDVRELEIAIFRRILGAEIKKTYFNHLKAASLVTIYEKSKEVLKENLRVSQKLVDSGKATIDVVYRANAEIARIEQKIAEAEKNRRITASYFNFLIGRSLDCPIEIIDLDEHTVTQDIRLDQSKANALMRREEIKLLHRNIEIQENSIWLARSANLPEVSAVFDYGFQGEEYSFTLDDDFWSASIVLEWELFDSLRTSSKARQAVLSKKRLETGLEELKRQIVLETEEAYHDLLVAQKSIQSTQEEFTSFEKIFEIIAKKYEQGICSQMEYMDAQTKQTNSEIGQLIARYDYLIRYAHFEAVTATGRDGLRRSLKEMAVKPKG
jgi:outer membrane protein